MKDGTSLLALALLWFAFGFGACGMLVGTMGHFLVNAVKDRHALIVTRRLIGMMRDAEKAGASFDEALRAAEAGFVEGAARESRKVDEILRKWDDRA